MLKSTLSRSGIIAGIRTVTLTLFLFSFSAVPSISAADESLNNKILTLEANFIGSNIIYFNKEKSGNTIKNDLVFYIRSLSSTTENIAAKQNESYIKIFFDYGNNPGDLASKTHASSFNLSIKQNYDNVFFPPPIDRGAGHSWVLKSKSNIFLQGGSNNRIELKFSDIASNLVEGIAAMYIEYGDIPGYENGRLSLPVIKQQVKAKQLKYGLYLGDDRQHGTEVNEFSADGTLGSSSDKKVPTQKAVKNYVDNRLPSGVIVMWSGRIADIPQEWALCDGNKGTPDLRNAFILGYGNRSIGDTGGQENVTLTVDQMPKHIHTGKTGILSFNEPNFVNDRIYGFLDASRKYANGVKPIRKSATINLAPSGNSQPHTNMPPFYVLAYIIKI